LDVAWNPDLAALPEEVEQLSTTHGGKCTINDNVMKRAVPTPADRDRHILLEWRASSTKLQREWSDVSAPVSAWEGVTVGAEGRVIKLELRSKSLSGVVPAELGGLTALKVLNLRWNQLTSVPAEIGKLTPLKVLDLNRNKLMSIPAELGRLTALTRLVLTGNHLTSVPAELAGLAALEVLDLGVNQLTSVPAQLGGLAALNVLNLRENQLTSVPEDLGGLTTMKVLYLHRNQLTSVPAALEVCTSAGTS